MTDAQQFRKDWEAAGPMVPGLDPMEAVDRLKKFQQMFEVGAGPSSALWLPPTVPPHPLAITPLQSDIPCTPQVTCRQARLLLAAAPCTPLACKRLPGAVAPFCIPRCATNFKHSTMLQAAHSFAVQPSHFNDHEQHSSCHSCLTHPSVPCLCQVRKRKWDNYSSGEELFGLQVTRYPELEQTEKEVTMLDRLYSLYVTVIGTIKGYGDYFWADVVEKIDEMGEQVGPSLSALMHDLHAVCSVCGSAFACLLICSTSIVVIVVMCTGDSLKACSSSLPHVPI